ncbi:MAG TPA: XdhC family protein [Puia sp.]|nr:XdhC family protein [Puia sp.]
MSPDKQITTWRLALTSLEEGIPVLLLYVLESRGSSPGRQGFFMVVNAKGGIEGSIGGGIMEHKFAEMARELLEQGDATLSIRRQVHDKTVTKDRSGMICSGEQTILLYTLREQDRMVVGEMVDCLSVGRNGTLRLSPAGIGFSSQAPPVDFSFVRSSDEDWIYEEKAGYKHHLFIVGGGHCALAFSRVMRMMDFRISIFDHRPELDTLSRNDNVHEKVFVKDYGELRERISSGVHSHYIVVMTQGYRTDDQAVRALLDKEFRYFGLLGSSAKFGKLLADYRAEGVAEALLGKIRSPAGLSIHSQTPEEIAISIAAEIIQVKNEGGGL